MNPSADFRRSHERSRRFPKIPRTLMKISGDHPNNSKDFWRSPEQFRRFLNFTRTSPKIPKDHLSTSEDWPNTSADFWRSPEDFWRSPKHFPGFPKTWDNLRRSPKITGYFRSFPQVSDDWGPSLFFFSYCSFPCKAVFNTSQAM